MRLLCIPLFLAVAIRPAGVYAHAELSDVATTADQVEVQGHVRVQDRPNDKSDDERMNPVISKVLEDGIYILESSEKNLIIHEGTSDVTTTNLNARKRKTKMLESQKKNPYKKGQSLDKQVSIFLGYVYAIQLREKSAKPKLSDLLPKRNRKDVILQANKFFKNAEKDPEQVFNLYLLPYAKKKVISKLEFRCWVQYLDNWKKTPVSLLEIVLTYYSIKELEKAIGYAMKKRPKKYKKSVERVESELENTFSDLTSPGDAYAELGLDGIEENLFDSPKFLYWMRYVSNYNSNTKNKFQKASTLDILFERYGKKKFLNDFKKFLKGFKGSNWTKDLKVEIKKAGIVLENE